MSASIKDFYDSNKYAILWTVGYVIVTWAIMRYMFDFNIFSAYRWHQLMHAHLHGFAGFVFGILILAMLPLYVATTVVIARNNAPLFDFKIICPGFIKTFFQNAFTQTPMIETESIEQETTVEQTTETVVEPAPTPAPEPEIKSEPESAPIPAELKVAYARARNQITRAQPSAFDLGHMTKTPAATQPAPEPEPVPVAENEMPIPTDFDIDETPKIVNDVPVFTDLDFGDDVDDDEDEPTPEINDVKTTTADNDAVTKYLNQKSIPYKTEDDIIVTDKFAIASHTDSDFWVADNESWFAAGKIRKSPIASVMAVAAMHHVQPVLYLGTSNIMDIDELRKQWERAGIRIITDPKDLM